MEDVEALRRCQRGDMDGLEPLIERYQARALQLAYLLTGDLALAEDITQDSFIQAFRQSQRFDLARPFAPWFFRITTNLARERMRWKRRLREVTLDAHLRGEQADQPSADDAVVGRVLTLDPATYAEQSEERTALFAALDALTPKQREAIILRYYLGCADSECASIAGCREGAFRVRLHDGLKALKQVLRQRYAWLLPPGYPSTDHSEVSRHVAAE